MDNIQQIIGEFSRKTFPDSNGCSKYNHLEREILELRQALQTGMYINIAPEIADCMILLFDIADYYGIDALEEVEVKHRINLTRKWGKPDEFGVVEHIETERIETNYEFPAPVKESEE